MLAADAAGVITPRELGADQDFLGGLQIAAGLFELLQRGAAALRGEMRQFGHPEEFIAFAEPALQFAAERFCVRRVFDRWYG
ncbi:hypothetical protein GCM10023319_55850 [Nocardia iowensis]